MLAGDSNGLVQKGKTRRLVVKDHSEMDQYLGRYSGLILYLKEMDEISYAKLCAVSRTPYKHASHLHAGVGVLLSIQRAAWHTGQGHPFDVQQHGEEAPR
jgi:hypothetical protein